MTAEAIAYVLGGPATLKRTIVTSSDLVQLTRDGVPSSSLDELASALSVNSSAIAAAIGLSTSVGNSSGKLSFADSDRAIRLARIFAQTIDVFKESAEAARWLQTPLPVFDGRTPFELLDTDAGSQSVETVLGRIAYGIYS